MLKKIALLVVMFALPLGAMAQTKFAHMNSQEAIVTMPEYTKAQAGPDAMSKSTKQKCNVPRKKSSQEISGIFLAMPTTSGKTLQKDVAKNFGHGTTKTQLRVK